ncbi:hypothetical protein EYZ11_008961 [Aspergillus tanneri]|uniref:Cytochrome oxidase c assembly-domain-containing protein n=1 Tax=Aspergillus tanneri TaxID=1220188 RepID=A0A4S3J965_9EURO|nr:uncharacterized protein ATNIH1004_011077 [Aspergillus tanneri]KAA8642136.1 hypothetical protein ATNIH1004_011077 [Aspergillus tanneri]THC91566.1 hypothetical protein EYZ11_008961 [Aspergillus tanneri]
MSRSAADATRFTATGPYASSKSRTTPYKLPGFMSNSATSSQSQGPARRSETPKEKVERLRAQVRAARLAQSTSRVDRMVDVGRRFANKAHKAMVYSLIAASGVCGALTVYSMVSLTLYNRRQRALWLEKELQTLQDAKMAYVSGSATAEQLELLKNEQIGEIMKQKKEEEKAQRPWNKMKQLLFGQLIFRGLKSEESPSETTSKSDGEPDSKKPGVLEALNAKALEDAKSNPSSAPGQLDTLAENAENAAKQTTRSWKGWFTGR